MEVNPMNDQNIKYAAMAAIAAGRDLPLMMTVPGPLEAPQCRHSLARRVVRELEARFRGVAVRPGRAAHEVRQAGRALYAHRRELHRIAWQSVQLLWTVRRAFPWALRVLVLVGAIQIPVLPFDEMAAVVALVWIVARYRPLARVIWRAAVLEVAR